MSSRHNDLVHQRIKSMVEQSGYAAIAPAPPSKFRKGAKAVLIAAIALALVEIPPPLPWHWGDLLEVAVAEDGAQVKGCMAAPGYLRI